MQCRGIFRPSLLIVSFHLNLLASSEPKIAPYNKIKTTSMEKGVQWHLDKLKCYSRHGNKVNKNDVLIHQDISYMQIYMYNQKQNNLKTFSTMSNISYTCRKVELI